MCQIHKKADVEITTHDGVVIVAFNSASISAAQGLEDISKKLADFIAVDYPKKVVVDFQGVKFFSSQVLGLLLYVWQKLQDYGGRVVISGINPQLHRVFKITNLDKIFEFYGDKEAAANDLRDS